MGRPPRHGRRRGRARARCLAVAAAQTAAAVGWLKFYPIAPLPCATMKNENVLVWFGLVCSGLLPFFLKI
jgi:hypothetical protein